MKNKNDYIKKTAGAERNDSVIAISKQQDRLKAVMLRKSGVIFELLWAKSTEPGRIDYAAFAEELTVAGEAGDKIVFGFNSTGLVFYHLELPQVRENELTALIQLQAEAKMPLPAEQMEFAWRADKAVNGQVAVTIAVAKKEQLERFAANTRPVDPAAIYLDCEAVVQVWKQFFQQQSQTAMVLSVSSAATYICMVENERLSNGVCLDIGTDDFIAGESAVLQRFVQDVMSVIELFGLSKQQCPVSVLSDGRGVIEDVVDSLRDGGLNAEAVLPETVNLNPHIRFTAEDVYEYHIPIGLALMQLDAAAEPIDLFKDFYNHPEQEKKSSRLSSPKFAAAVAAAVVILFLFVFYLIDIATLKSVEKCFADTQDRISVSQLVERQRLVKKIALQRPDLLKLLNKINDDKSKGIILDAFAFKSGKAITLSGRADNDDQLYQFQKNLLEQAGISDVKRGNVKKESKGNKLNFTISFHYKNFTKKKARVKAI